MSTATTDLRVTIVSADRELLSDLSWTLSIFGYHVTATCDFSDESPCRREQKPGLLLVDTRDNPELADLLTQPTSPSYVYRIAIETAEATEKVLLKGADDVVGYPVNTGELLTRMRAGVRRLEFENRLLRYAKCDPDTGILTRNALVQTLQSANASHPPQSCVAFGIDYSDQLREQYGVHAIRHLRSTLARCIERRLTNTETCGVLGDYSMLVALDRTKDAAREFAKAITGDFSISDTLVREIRSVPTISAAVVEWNSEAPATELLDRCESTLEQVHYFGGDHIAMASEVQQRIAEWRSDLDEGVPFENVVAQDLMELFPAILTCEEAAQNFEAALPTPDLQLPCMPVVDEEGKLVRALQFSSFYHPTDSSGANKLHTVEYNQPLSDLFEAFNSSESDYLVVVDDQFRPLGYLTCEGLASLVLDQVNASRYAAEDNSDRHTASLVVPVVPMRPNAHAKATAT
ncbi:hypothetical protein [Aeoliella mucimassa]|uniref:Response regulator PleD n=1 Tax=Aeoliella mucimassa TaxID=2527972 RepID=A0A518AK88_9BACT|nr:hypothetical protein [Aeoliella mucimassa]QDU55094.1 response regulator PleD [Aeoliella mucimassa]